MNKSIVYNTDLISIVIPWFNRPDYLPRVLDAIHQYADYPFEIIIHDDSSRPESKAIDELMSHRDRISTLILRSGLQLGLSESVNRAVSLAASNYILFMNSDCFPLRSFFQDLVNTLSKPYIGIVSLNSPYRAGDEYIESNGTKFQVLHGINGGDTMGFRKDFWDEVGGWESDMITGFSDCAFLFKCWKYGYFRAGMSGPQCVKNESREEKGNTDSTIGKFGELAYNKIFNLEADYEALCTERFNFGKDYSYVKQKFDRSLTDLPYWDSYSKDIFRQLYKISEINWEHAKRHGQYKWKAILLKEVTIER